MQFTDAQRRFFIDPVQDPTIECTRLLVTEERTTRGTHLDKIVNVRPKRTTVGARVWWVTEGGDHVAGAPVNPTNLMSHQRIIAPGGEGWFWLGNVGRRTGDVHVTGEARRSDGKTLPGLHGNRVFTFETRDAVRAASWAAELVPLSGDSDEVALAKLQLAEQRWNQRRAKAEIIRQGLQRGWEDDLQDLRDSGKLPSATFGAYYKGGALVVASTPALSVRDAGRIEAYREAMPGVTPGGDVLSYIGLEVDTPLGIHVESFDDIRKLPTSSLRDALRSAVNDYSAIPGEYQLTPVLRSVA